MEKSDLNKPNRPKDPMGFIIQQLKFDDNQLQKLELINENHHHKMRKIGDNVKELKDALFNKLSDAFVNKSTIDSITTLIGDKEKAKETEAFYHFKRIQEICNDEQKEKFKEIINDAIHKGGEQNQRPPRLEGFDRPRHPPPGGHDENRPPPKH